MSEPFVGEIRQFAGNYAPRGWAFCDGQLLQVSDNDALFSLLGTIYGGDGETTFALPDLRCRLALHQGNGPGLSERSLGARGGEEEVTLTTSQLPAHRHALAATDELADTADPTGAVPAQPTTGDLYAEVTPDVDMAAEAVLPAGGGEAHDNLMPYETAHWIIALQGIFPSES